MPVELYNKAYHFTHVDNLPGIARHGLLSHSGVQARGVSRHDISDRDVQQWRSRSEPVFERRIHDYVPLYLNPRNAMQYKLLDLSDQLVMLAIDISDFIRVPVLFTDGNAACRKTRFGTGLGTVAPSDDVLRAEFWAGHEDGKRRRCAEMLVPDRIPVSLMSAVCLRNGRTRDIANDLVPGGCAVDPSLFFRA